MEGKKVKILALKPLSTRSKLGLWVMQESWKGSGCPGHDLRACHHYLAGQGARAHRSKAPQPQRERPTWKPFRLRDADRRKGITRPLNLAAPPASGKARLETAPEKERKARTSRGIPEKQPERYHYQEQSLPEVSSMANTTYQINTGRNQGKLFTTETRKVGQGVGGAQVRVGCV